MNTLSHWTTAFERGNGNQTTTWTDCVAFHQRLAQAHPQWLRFEEAGRSDGGVPIHVGVFSADGEFEPASVKAAGRPVFFNNNGIHPGEPEGIDACMALLRDLCLDAAQRAALGRTVLVYIPAYNVDGLLNRGDTSRVNQNGPEAFGFRGNARHLDLNRDFIKADSLATRTFTRVFTRWDPDVMVDTHTSNGADYQHVMTLIATQSDKLGGRTGEHLREQMLPALYADMAARGFPMCPYVNPLHEIPDDGITAMLDTPRFSTGYAALHHTIGFMPETHMLKPFEDRYRSTRALLEAALAHTTAHGDTIGAARAADRAAVAAGAPAVLEWTLDLQRSRTFRFSGFKAVREASRLGHYQRLRYDRAEPWVRDVVYHDRYVATTTVSPPRAYVLPQAWRDVAERLQAHGLPLQTVQRAGRVQAQVWRIGGFDKRALPFEGRHLHTRLDVRLEDLQADISPGDWLLPLGGPHDRVAIEMLEPQAADSYFRWAFFDSVLGKKEGFSDYVFEDEAERLLATEPGLAQRFEIWKAAHPEQLSDPQAVLGFIFLAAQRYAEPEWRRYPVLRLAVMPAELLQGPS